MQNELKEEHEKNIQVDRRRAKFGHFIKPRRAGRRPV
jgi:hypothetical protein